MSTQERIDGLRAQHQNLEKMLDNEKHRLPPDDVNFADLKRQKLTIKDQIASRRAQA